MSQKSSFYSLYYTSRPTSSGSRDDARCAQEQAKRIGRGIGSGKGKTAGRGHKGQKARTGALFYGLVSPLMAANDLAPERTLHWLTSDPDTPTVQAGARSSVLRVGRLRCA